MTEAETKDDDWSRRIQDVKQAIESRLDDEISLDELATLAHASTFHFHRVFRGMTGETVRGYARRLRLERAARWIRDDQIEIIQAALRSGYGSHEAFSRAFKSRFACSPSDFRNQSDRTIESRKPMATSPISLEVRRARSVRVAYVRHTGPYSDVGQAWKSLMKWGWTRCLFRKPTMFGLCYDDPEVTESQHLRYEACLVVGENTRESRRMSVRDLPEGQFAVTVHSGGYATLGETYARLCAAITSRQIEKRSWRLAEPPSREIYLTDPRSTPAEDMRTEIWMPIVPA